jgi:hypothetical protein
VAVAGTACVGRREDAPLPVGCGAEDGVHAGTVDAWEPLARHFLEVVDCLSRCGLRRMDLAFALQGAGEVCTAQVSGPEATRAEKLVPEAGTPSRGLPLGWAGKLSGPDAR